MYREHGILVSTKNKLQNLLNVNLNAMFICKLLIMPMRLSSKGVLIYF